MVFRMSAAAKGGARFPLKLDQLGTAARSPARDDASLVASRTAFSVSQVQGGAVPAPQRTHLAAPVGLGLDSADVRRKMVQRLALSGVRHSGLLKAMEAVARHEFLDSGLVAQAYEDTSLPIGHGQTISKPSTVARLIELLLEGASAREKGHLGRVLEIGTGCGYQAAVLSQLSRFVISVERVKPLHDRARVALGAVCAPDVLRLVYGDGLLGHPPNAPYDSIVAAAGGSELPQTWLDQLAPGGRLVMPLHRPGTESQMLVVADRTEHGIRRSEFEAVKFVPLKSGLIA